MPRIQLRPRQGRNSSTIIFVLNLDVTQTMGFSTLNHGLLLSLLHGSYRGDLSGVGAESTIGDVGECW